MHATQLLAHPVFAEKIRNVLSVCQRALTPREYARRLVETVADITDSQYAVWLNWPDGPESLVAETEGFSSRHRVLSLCACVPRLSNEVDAREGVHSVLAAPIMFRSSITGVLAVANGARPYTPADLDLLREIARAAVLEYETLERTEALGLASAWRQTVDLVHGLRQPLSILEACAFYLDLVLPAGEEKAREQLAQMQKQIDRASGMLDDCAQGHPPEFEEVPGILTTSAMSMAT
jgi:signal transduction histidine kinase